MNAGNKMENEYYYFFLSLRLKSFNIIASVLTAHSAVAAAAATTTKMTISCNAKLST